MSKIKITNIPNEQLEEIITIDEVINHIIDQYINDLKNALMKDSKNKINRSKGEGNG